MSEFTQDEIIKILSIIRKEKGDNFLEQKFSHILDHIKEKLKFEYDYQEMYSALFPLNSASLRASALAWPDL